MVRFGQSVIHNIASVMGGAASQEVAKIITHKFMPINNTFIFNGICGVAGTYEL
jgi:amyloid beta precursor protein binding protein 1